MNTVRVISYYGIYFDYPFIIGTVIKYLIYSFYLSFVVQIFRWYFYIYKYSRGKPISTDQNLCAIYVTAFLFVVAGIFINLASRENPTWFNFSGNDLMTQTCLYAVFYVFFSAFHGRVLQRETIVAQVSFKYFLLNFLFSFYVRVPIVECIGSKTNVYSLHVP